MTHSSLNMASQRRQTGFTLIEIMIVVLIVGVLMAIAYPNYQNHVIKTRRAAAAACVIEVAQFMERHYTTRLSYLAADGNPPPLPTMQCRSDLNNFYSIDVDAANTSARAYRIQAAPKTGTQQAKDTKCATLSVDQTGAKKVSNTSTNVAECW